jgi:hypothetical protein
MPDHLVGGFRIRNARHYYADAVGSDLSVVVGLQKMDHSFPAGSFHKLDLTKEPPDAFMTDPVWTITGIVFVLLAAFPRVFHWDYFAAWMVMMVAIGIIALVLVMVRQKHRANAQLEQMELPVK